MSKLLKSLSAVGLLTLVVGQGCPMFNPTTATQSDFERVWSSFNERYARFAVPAAEDWDEVHDEYAEQFATDLSPADFASRLARMLAELNDPQVTVTGADGAPVPVVERAIRQNFPDAYSATYFPSGLQQLANRPLRHGMMAGDIAYVSIEGLTADEWQGLTSSEVDGLLAPYASAAAMIIDMRRATDGSEDVGRAIAAHFADSDFVYGFSQVRTDPADRTALGATKAHTMTPASGTLFTKPVALLTSQGNMNGAEWLILMMRGTGRTTVVGDVSRGACGDVETITLSNGVQYTLPIAAVFTAEMGAIEGEGVHPDLWIETAGTITAGDDRVLQRAIDLLTH